MKKAFLAGLFLCLSVPLASAQSQVESYQWAEKIYHFSSISATVSQVSGQVDEMLEESKSEYSEADFAELTQFMKVAFSEDDIRADVLSSISSEISPDTARVVLDWLTQPGTVRMQKMEAGAEDDEAAMIAYVQELNMEDEQTVQRVNILHGLLQKIGGAEVMTDMVASMMKAMMVATQEVSAPGEKMTLGEIDMQVAEMKDTMLPQLEQGLVVMMLYAYRDASVDDLSRYAAYYSTPEGAWYNRATSNALKFAFENVGARMGTQLGSIQR